MKQLISPNNNKDLPDLGKRGLQLNKVRSGTLLKQNKEQNEHKTCQRFLEKGNKPVPRNYDEHEIVVVPKPFDPASSKFNEVASLTGKDLNESQSPRTTLNCADQN